MRTCPECGARLEDTTCRGDGCPTLPDPAPGSPPAAPEVGSLIAGKYRVLGVVGRGGMSVVYRAWQRDMRRVVALKVASTQPSDPAGARRFLREVQMVAGLSHPNTVRIFDYGQTEDGRLFFTMEFLEGEPLGRALRRREPFDDRRVARVATQVLKSLGEAHSAGIVHRDLSPDNIFLVRMFGETDHVKVLDFGVAKGGRFESDDDRLTTQGMFVGKPAFASPEQAEGVEELDGRSDLYSLGVVMYQMVSGRVPFQSATPMQVLIAQIRDDPRPLQAVAPRPVDPDLAAFVMRLLSKRREDRPASAHAALTELEEAARRMEEKAHAVAPPGRDLGWIEPSAAVPGRKPGSRHAWFAVVVAVVLAAAAAMAVVAGLTGRGPTAAAPPEFSPVAEPPAHEQGLVPGQGQAPPPEAPGHMPAQAPAPSPATVPAQVPGPQPAADRPPAAGAGPTASPPPAPAPRKAEVAPRPVRGPASRPRPATRPPVEQRWTF